MRNSLVSADDWLLEQKLPTCTEQEFENYMWHKFQDGKPNKELPVDKDNHGMDPLRYGVMYVDNSGGVMRRTRRTA